MQTFLFKFTLDVEELAVTSDNVLHYYGGTTYTASAIECKEISYDLKEIVGQTNITIPWEQSGFLQAITLHTLEGAVAVTMYEYDTVSDAGTLVFSGFINTFKVSKAELALECVSFVEFARDNFPRACLTRHCNHRLYSSLCSLDSALYTGDGTIQAVSSDRCTIEVSGASLTQAGGWYTYGYIRVGGSFRYIVSDSYNGSYRIIDVLHPCPSDWAFGTSASVTAGCDKASTTCQTKFNNFPQFLGFPYAPLESVRFTGLRGQEVETNKKGK